MKLTAKLAYKITARLREFPDTNLIGVGGFYPVSSASLPENMITPEMLDIIGNRHTDGYYNVSVWLLTVDNYGITVSKSPVDSIRLLNEMPTLTHLGGFGVGNTQRGQVRIHNLGEGLAFIRANSPPYIFIELLNTGNYVFLNLHNANDTRQLYRDLQEWLR